MGELEAAKAAALSADAAPAVDANELVADIHDRMPVLLPESAWTTWLDPENQDVAELAKLLVPAPSEQLEMWPVSTAVNSADNKGSEVVNPVEPIEPAP